MLAILFESLDANFLSVKKFITIYVLIEYIKRNFLLLRKFKGYILFKNHLFSF